jgi:hypothetical protein
MNNRSQYDEKYMTVYNKMNSKNIPSDKNNIILDKIKKNYQLIIMQ